MRPIERRIAATQKSECIVSLPESISDVVAQPQVESEVASCYRRASVKASAAVHETCMSIVLALVAIVCLIDPASTSTS